MKIRIPIRLAPHLVVALLFCLGSSRLFAQAPAAALSQRAASEIAALFQEKASWTPAQRKLDSQLVHAAKHNRGEPFAPGAPRLQMDVKLEGDGRVQVDISATVTPELLTQIRAGGGQVISSIPRFRSVRALLRLDQLETLAASTNVNYIRRATQPRTSMVDSEGDTTHQANLARTHFGVTGAGINIGVLSDSVDNYTNLQSAGELPTVTILPDQSYLGWGGTGEGTAMLEIVHDLAPAAGLYFATGEFGVANFANNILNLASNGCQIIVDDLTYPNEPVFQDGLVAQAVNTVTAQGVLYFSSAGNSGNLDDKTSGTWEGDFADGGPAVWPIPEGGRIHSFGPANHDTCTGGYDLRVDLWWADPLGASTNDYDLFVLDSNGVSVVESSMNTQNGFQDPYESVGALTNGNRIVIVKVSGDARFLHLSTGRGQLSIATAGTTGGHSSAVNAFSVAAIDQHSAYPNPFSGMGNNPFEQFTSDGPRRIFFNADGSAITPGNFSGTGGLVRQKPDIAAADGVSTDAPGFGSFYGTSAAAPHAAAIAALLRSYQPSLTPSQIRAILTSTALDVDPPGADRDTGYGIVMAYPTLLAASLTPASGNIWVDFNYGFALPQTGDYWEPFSQLAAGLSAVPAGGNIWIRTTGSTPETMTISKPVTIGPYAGPATIGR